MGSPSIWTNIIIMRNSIITVEKDIRTGAERLVEVIPAATGEGWIYTLGQFITAWTGNAWSEHFSSRLPKGKGLEYSHIWQALNDQQTSSWEEPAFIVVAGTVYHTGGDRKLEKGASRPTLEFEVPEDKSAQWHRGGYYRPYWRIGSVCEIWADYCASEEETAHNQHK